MFGGKLWMGLLVLLVSTSVGLAQGAPVDVPGSDQKPTATQPGMPRIPMMMPAQHMKAYDDFVAGCEMDEAQKTKLKALLTAADEDFIHLRDEIKPTDETRKKMAENLKAMQEARKAGDQNKETELRKERTRMATEFTEKRQLMIEKMKARDEELHGEIKAMLRPEQIEKFETVWKDKQILLDVGPRGPVFSTDRNPRALKAAVDRLADLTPDQKAGVESAFKTYQEAARAPSARNNRTESARIIQTLYDQVLGLLTEGQREKVQAELKPRSPIGAGGAKTGDDHGQGANPHGDKPADPPAKGDQPAGDAKPTDGGQPKPAP